MAWISTISGSKELIFPVMGFINNQPWCIESPLTTSGLRIETNQNVHRLCIVSVYHSVLYSFLLLVRFMHWGEEIYTHVLINSSHIITDKQSMTRKSLVSFLFTEDKLTFDRRESTGVNNKTNGCIPFSCFSSRVLVLFMLDHWPWVTVMVHWDTWIEQSQH